MSIRAVKIEANVVVESCVAPSVQWCEQHLGGTWMENPADGSQHGKYAGIGDIYDPVTDTFSSPEEEE